MSRLALAAGIALAVTGSIAAVYQGGHRPEGEDANAAAKAARTKPHVMFDPAEYAGDGEPAVESLGSFLGWSFDYWRTMLFPAVKPPEPVPHPPASGSAPRALDVPPPKKLESAAGPVNPSTWISSERASASSSLLDGAFRMAGIETALRLPTMALLDPAPVPFVPATRFPGTSSSTPDRAAETPTITANSVLWVNRSALTEPLLLEWTRYFQIESGTLLFASFAAKSPTYPLGTRYLAFIDPFRFLSPNGGTPDTITAFLFPDPGSQDLPGDVTPPEGSLAPPPNINLDDPPASVPEPRSILLVTAAFYFLILKRLSSTPN